MATSRLDSAHVDAIRAYVRSLRLSDNSFAPRITADCIDSSRLLQEAVQHDSSLQQDIYVKVITEYRVESQLAADGTHNYNTGEFSAQELHAYNALVGEYAGNWVGFAEAFNRLPGCSRSSTQLLDRHRKQQRQKQGQEQQAEQLQQAIAAAPAAAAAAGDRVDKLVQLGLQPRPVQPKCIVIYYKEGPAASEPPVVGAVRFRQLAASEKASLGRINSQHSGLRFISDEIPYTMHPEEPYCGYNEAEALVQEVYAAVCTERRNVPAAANAAAAAACPGIARAHSSSMQQSSSSGSAVAAWLWTQRACLAGSSSSEVTGTNAIPAAAAAALRATFGTTAAVAGHNDCGDQALE